MLKQIKTEHNDEFEGQDSGNKKEISILKMWYMIVTSSKLIKIEDLSLLYGYLS